MAEIFAQPGNILRIANNQLAVAAVGAGKVAGQWLADKRIAAAQLRRVVVTIAANLTARQHRAFGPGWANALIVRGQFLERVFCQLTVGGELAAKHRQQRRFAVVVMDIQRIVAGDRLRRIRLVVTQRAHAGVGPDDIFTSELFLKVAVVDLQQIANLAFVDFDVFRIAVVLHVGGANNWELVHPRDHKHDALIFVLQNVGLLLVVHARYHNMAALDQADAVWRRLMHPVVEELFDPRAGGIHQAARLPAEFFAAVDIFRFHHPQAVFTFRRDCARTGSDFAAFFHHHLRISQDQASIVDPAVWIFETAHDFRLQDRLCAKTQTGRRRQAGTLAQVIVHKQTGTDHPRRAQMRAVWQTKTHRNGDVRGHLQQHFTLGQRFADQTEFVVFKVAQAAMDQFRAGARRGAGQISGFQHQHG